MITPQDNVIVKIWNIAKEQNLEISGVSWAGFNLVGDKKSIDEAKRLMDTEHYLQGVISELRRRLDDK